MFRAHKGLSLFVQKVRAGIEVAHEKELLVQAGFSGVQYGVPKTGLRDVCGVPLTGPRGHNMKHPNTESVLRQVDVEPMAESLRRRGARPGSPHGCAREGCDAIHGSARFGAFDV